MGKTKKKPVKDVDDIEDLDPTAARTRHHVKKITKKKERFRERLEHKARAEILNQQEEGCLTTEGGKPTYRITQQEIVDNVDIASATKYFTLDLDHGPYKVDYTLNGRHLLLGGKDGHLAAFDWMTKRLHTEIQVPERVQAVRWLHNENMFAAAQKRWTYVYDQNGTELHCVKSLFDVHWLEFLPRHFLLAGLSSTNFLTYLDVSTGQVVSTNRIKQADPTCMTQNRSNAILLSGNSKGVVCMWAPNQKEALVEILANRAPLSGISVHKEGVYMATIGMDNLMKIWDLRNYKELSSHRLLRTPNQVAFSDRQQLAVSFGANIQVYSDVIGGNMKKPYMQYRAASAVSSLNFCPYEDVLGAGLSQGFCSLLIPGSGDPNFDALHANPFESKRQRQEREVKQLLEKIQPHMITLDPRNINRVNQQELQKNIDYRTNVMHWQKTDINTNPSRYFSRKKTLK